MNGFPITQLNYDLPEELVAQQPLADRSASRMLVVDRKTSRLEDRTVAEFPAFLAAGDALVLNETRVVPAKFALRRETGGRIDGLFLHEHGPGDWDVLLKGAQRLRTGEVLTFEGGGQGERVIPVTRGERGQWRVRVEPQGSAAAILDKVGRMPLPPYIKRGRASDVRDPSDRDRYQTVFAANDGAVAAPTAGLHFTDSLLEQVATRGVHLEKVTLHVGYGTFAPLEVDDLADHAMHAEYYSFSEAAAGRLRAVRDGGGRVVAVGTTSARVLETVWAANAWMNSAQGWTSLFCYPPYRFGGVDALLTNFHLPRSTLLALVMSLVGVELTRQAYAHAIAKGYRFYSYGDAMLIV